MKLRGEVESGQTRGFVIERGWYRVHGTEVVCTRCR